MAHGLRSAWTAGRPCYPELRLRPYHAVSHADLATSTHSHRGCAPDFLRRLRVAPKPFPCLVSHLARLPDDGQTLAPCISSALALCPGPTTLHYAPAPSPLRPGLRPHHTLAASHRPVMLGRLPHRQPSHLHALAPWLGAPASCACSALIHVRFRARSSHLARLPLPRWLTPSTGLRLLALALRVNSTAGPPTASSSAPQPCPRAGFASSCVLHHPPPARYAHGPLCRLATSPVARLLQPRRAAVRLIGPASGPATCRLGRLPSARR